MADSRVDSLLMGLKEVAVEVSLIGSQVVSHLLLDRIG